MAFQELNKTSMGLETGSSVKTYSKKPRIAKSSYFASNYTGLSGLSVLITSLAFVGLVSLLVLFPVFENIEVQKHYYKIFKSLLPFNNNYILYLTLVNYGNYMLYKDKFPSEVGFPVQGRGLNNLNSFSKLYGYMKREQVDDFKIILHGDLCQRIHDLSFTTKQDRMICDQYLPAKSGLFGVIKEEVALTKAMMNEMLALKPYLEATKEQFLPSPFYDQHMKETPLKMRLMHDIVMKGFQQVLFVHVNDALEERYRYQNSCMKIINYIWGLGIVPASLFQMWKINTYFRKSLIIAYEAFRIIDVRILTSNAYTRRSLELAYK